MSTRSKQLAALGPTILAISASEGLNMGVYKVQTPPVVYLNGTILFVAGLALVRAHNTWRRDWTVMVTFCGWVAMVGGLYRMFFPSAPQAGQGASTYVMLAVLFGVGAALTVLAYRERMTWRH